MAVDQVLVEEERVTDVVPLKRALVSVYDKSGLELLAEILKRHGIAVFSTGKTLDPKLFAGILSRRSKKEHRTTLKEQGWENIDLVVVNLYPFEATVQRQGVSEEEAMETIDIGGPSLLRAAAKNFESVTAITGPEEYELLTKELQANGGARGPPRRESWRGRVV